MFTRCVLILSFFAVLTPAQQCGDTDAACFIKVSDGREICYYYPVTGYECEYCDGGDCSGVDPTRRGLPSCCHIGQCYVPISGDENEVCYYTPPFGYDCYFKYEEHIVANLTHCDDLKANSAPEIEFQDGFRATQEDVEFNLPWIYIVDLDADDAISDGNGYMLVTISVSNGQLRFDPDLAPTPGERIAAQTVLETARLKSNGGVQLNKGTRVGNAGEEKVEWIDEIIFEARQKPMQDLMKSLVYRTLPNFNTNKGNSRIVVHVDDQGNTGGNPESDQDQVIITAEPVNDAPTIVMDPPLPITNEDTDKSIPSLTFDDVDIGETPNAVMEVTLEVSKGTLWFPDGWRLAVPSCPSNPVCSMFVPEGGNKKLTISSTLGDLNNYIKALIYRPNPNENDDTLPGVDQLTVTVNDNGNTGSGTPVPVVTYDLHVSPVNDAPEVAVPDPLTVDEDSELTGFSITITDVDSTTGLNLQLSVSNGELTVTDPTPQPKAATVTVGGLSLTDIAALLATIKYEPNLNFNGEDTLVVTVDDGIDAADPSNVAITVEAVNDEPTVCLFCPGCTDCSVPGNFAVSSGNRIMFNGNGDGVATTGSNVNGPRIEVDDVDADDKPVQILLVAFEGTLEFTGTTGLTFTTPELYGGGPERVFLFMGTVVDINAAISTLIYERTDNPVDRFLVAVNDMQNQGKGEAMTDIQQVTIDLV